MIVRALSHGTEKLWCAGCFAYDVHPFRYVVDRGTRSVGMCEACAKKRCPDGVLPPVASGLAGSEGSE